MSSSSPLTFSVPSRDNFAQVQSAQSKAATRVTVKPYLAHTPTSPVTRDITVRTPLPGKRFGVYLDAKA
jgi:hypothetical protein